MSFAKLTNTVLFVLFLSFLSACEYFHTHENKNQIKNTSKVTPIKNPRADRVITKELQDKLTPYDVLERLKAGNKRFASQQSIVRNYDIQRRKAVSGQYPKAIILSCVDSRVPVEDVFDQGIGDVFVARVAGNIASPEILGSIEYATAVAGVKIVLVMGHEHCGAIKASIDNVKMGNITSLTSAIQQPILNLSDYIGKKSSKNPAYVHKVCESNVNYTVAQIRSRSKIIDDLEKEGKVQVIGGIYDLDTGIVSFM